MGRGAMLAAVVILAGGGVTWADTPEGDPGPAPGTVVHVRVYNTAGVAAEDLPVAAGEAVALLRSAGVEAKFSDCSSSAGGAQDGAAICRRPARGDLVMRLSANHGTIGSGFATMGYALVNVETPSFASVYVDVVQKIARDNGIDARVLLGRAVAHEVGHLLLNTNRHADRGLMRAQWSRVELSRANHTDWGFSEAEALRMRAGIASRTRP